MSLTETAEVFASIHEQGLNDILTAFFTDRPRYLVYGSPAFVPSTSVAATAMPAIPFPGVPGGIQWRVRLSIPVVDLFKQTTALPPELTLAPGQFSLSLIVELCLDCRRIQIDPRPPRDKTDEGRPRDGQPVPGPDWDRHRAADLTCFKLKLFAVGHIVHVLAATGDDAIAFALDAVEIVDIKPPEVEAFLECLLFMILQAVLADVNLPLPALRAGAFHLSLTQGPLIEDDQMKARGNV